MIPIKRLCYTAYLKDTRILDVFFHYYQRGIVSFHSFLNDGLDSCSFSPLELRVGYTNTKLLEQQVGFLRKVIEHGNMSVFRWRVTKLMIFMTLQVAIFDYLRIFVQTELLRAVCLPSYLNIELYGC